MRSLYRYVVVKGELSQKTKLSMYRSIFVLRLTCGLDHDRKNEVPTSFFTKHVTDRHSSQTIKLIYLPLNLKFIFPYWLALLLWFVMAASHSKHPPACSSLRGERCWYHDRKRRVAEYKAKASRIQKAGSEEAKRAGIELYEWKLESWTSLVRT